MDAHHIRALPRDENDVVGDVDGKLHFLPEKHLLGRTIYRVDTTALATLATLWAFCCGSTGNRTIGWAGHCAGAAVVRLRRFHPTAA